MSERLAADAGLTILELMIVLVILGLVGTVVAVQVVGQLDRAKVDIARLQLRQLQSALALFELDTNRSPSEAEGLGALLAAPEGTPGWRGPYLRNATLLDDPWGTPVAYRSAGDSYQLMSLGADRREGGEGAGTDLTLDAAE